MYVHHVPGRLKLQANRFRANRRVCDEIRMAAASIDGVIEATANPTTGSLIIQYDRRRLTRQCLWQSLCERRIVWGRSPISNGDRVTRIVLQQPASPADQLIQALAGFLVEKLTERSAALLLGALI